MRRALVTLMTDVWPSDPAEVVASPFLQDQSCLPQAPRLVPRHSTAREQWMQGSSRQAQGGGGTHLALEDGG